MKIYGGYLTARRIDGRTTAAITLNGMSEIDASQKAFYLALERYPSNSGYFGQRAELIEVTQEQLDCWMQNFEYSRW